jgi:hypothetical protein
MHKKSLNYYSGNYDQYVQTRAEQEENQMKRYKWEQEQISHMKVRARGVLRARGLGVAGGAVGACLLLRGLGVVVGVLAVALSCMWECACTLALAF